MYFWLFPLILCSKLCGGPSRHKTHKGCVYSKIQKTNGILFFQHYLMQQQQQASMAAGNPQQPMFHPAMYGPMSGPGSMPMMGVPTYQHYMPPGQYQPMSPGPNQPTMVSGPMSMPMGMPMPPMTSDQQQQAPVTPSFNMQGLSTALPTYQSLPQSPHLQHHQLQQQQQQPMSMMGQPHLPPQQQQQQVMQQQPGMMAQQLPQQQHIPQQQQPQHVPQQQQQPQQFDQQELISFD